MTNDVCIWCVCVCVMVLLVGVAYIYISILNQTLSYFVLSIFIILI